MTATATFGYTVSIASGRVSLVLPAKTPIPDWPTEELSAESEGEVI